MEVTHKIESPGAGGSRFGHEDAEADKANQEMEARYGQAREEDYAKRDRVLNRLMSAEKPQDVAAALEVVRDYENPYYGESIDRYTFGAYKRASVEGQRAFEKGSKDIEELKRLGIVSEDAVIDTNGDLVGGKVRASGYAIGVREVRGEEKPRTITKVRYPIDPQTGKRGIPEVVEETESNGYPKEIVRFGTAAERLALARAHEELHRILVTSEILQNQTDLFDKTRAALEVAVKYFYNDQIYFSNLQTKWFFTAADIGKMDHTKPETLNNQELGDRRDKGMRLNYLVGMSETKEKMLEHLNTTFNLEEILDYSGESTETLDRVLKLAGIEGMTDKDEKFKAAAMFLISQDLVLTKAAGGTWRYDLPTWLTRDQRDPTKEGKGEKAIKGEKGARGYLTEFGNPYIKDSRDQFYTLEERMIDVVGDSMAVREAGRYFWTRGMRDELGMEIYSFNENGTPNLPSGEDLVTYFNSHSFEEWQEYCSGEGNNAIEKRYKIPGEPVGSDLSKLFHTKMWRLKEMMKDRSAGPYLTYSKIERLTESLLSLCSTKVEVGTDTADGQKLMETRSVREAWLGFKSNGADPSEQAKDLGKIEWEQPPASEDVRKEFNESAVRDNNEAYFWTMNFLAGDDNIGKRPWQFIMKGVERPGDLQRPEAYTDKIKFLKIIWHDNVLAWGNWREVYKKGRAANPRQGRKTQIDAAEAALKAKVLSEVDKTKKAWYEGLRSMPEYSFWMTQQEKYVKFENGIASAGTIGLIQIIEGSGKDKPGLAVKFGFMDASQIGKPPQHGIRFYR
jgi:hypothetical protein